MTPNAREVGAQSVTTPVVPPRHPADGSVAQGSAAVRWNGVRRAAASTWTFPAVSSSVRSWPAGMFDHLRPPVGLALDHRRLVRLHGVAAGAKLRRRCRQAGDNFRGDAVGGLSLMSNAWRGHRRGPALGIEQDHLHVKDADRLVGHRPRREEEEERGEDERARHHCHRSRRGPRGGEPRLSSPGSGGCRIRGTGLQAPLVHRAVHGPHGRRPCPSPS